jgi:hypothetical protein
MSLRRSHVYQVGHLFFVKRNRADQQLDGIKCPLKKACNQGNKHCDYFRQPYFLYICMSSIMSELR